MDLSVGDVTVIGVMEHDPTHSHFSKSTVALWILQFGQGGLQEREEQRGKVGCRIKKLGLQQ